MHLALQAVILGAAAGGLGWGIRGQYGHETGAMIAGLLVSLTLVLLLARDAPALTAARAVAWCTVAIGFGGSMTYGQTVGLTHGATLVGNWPALGWGMLGLAIKGGIWIGFGALFLGMGLGGARYRPIELLALMGGLLVLFWVGVWVLNSPFDPSRRLLPAIYFSADWRWEPDANLKPRREVWGGLLLALAGAIAYAGAWRRDRLALSLAFWGLAGGALGFPLGQSLQALHAWNPQILQGTILAGLDPHLNWWNLMETTFGAVFGATLGLGLWRCRGLIPQNWPRHPVSIPSGLEWALVLVHTGLLVAGEFLAIPWTEFYAEIGLFLGIIPLTAIAGGRWWPYLLALPVTLLPIAGKTLRHLAYENAVISITAGWILYLILPVGLAAAAAVMFAPRSQTDAGTAGSAFLRRSLLLATWLYFGLNFAFFRFPWPWLPWTTRTPNAIIFTLCAGLLTLAALHPKLASGTRSR